MKKLILIFVLLFSYNNMYCNTLDSIKTVAKNSINVIDTSSNFKMIYNDIKDGITGLAVGLKVGSEKVWDILVLQQHVKSYVYILMYLFSFISLIFFFKFYKSKEIWLNEYDSPTLLGVLRLLQVLISLIVFLIATFNIDTILTGFINPEYGAIQDIIEFTNPHNCQ